MLSGHIKRLFTLFEPTRVGTLELSHRIVLAPLTRYRANKAHVHGDLGVTYYEQRASTPGTLLISEATLIAEEAGGYDHVPRLYTDEQLKGWKRVANAVHNKGSFLYAQLWALGRTANENALTVEGQSSPSVELEGTSLLPAAFTRPEIKEYVRVYAQAAQNAVTTAGFDGVELHAANGYLIDQFLQGTCAHDTDEYGGSVENRCRFGLEMMDAVVAAIGAERVGIRLSPWSKFQDMGMADPIPTFTHLVSELKKRHPTLAYIHVIEPRVHGNEVSSEPAETDVKESNDFLRDIWAPRPFIAAGGFDPQSALSRADEKGDLVAFGRYFISNPDLPNRIKKGVPLTPYDRKTFYVPESPVGYIDQAFAEECARL